MAPSTGGVILALHGGALTPAAWEPVLAAAPDLRFFVPDLNEIAASLHPSADWDELVDAVAAVAPPGRFLLAGTTVGGRLGLSVADRLGSRVQGVYLLTPFPPDEPPAFLDMLAGLRRYAVGSLSAKQIDVQVGMMLHRWGPRFGSAARELQSILAEGAIRGRALARISTNMGDAPSHWIERLPCPVHVRFGIFDPMCRQDLIEAWRAMPNAASVEAWQDVAHHLTLEAPEQVAADLRALSAP